MSFIVPKPDDVLVIADPSTVGDFPIREDITVLPADDPAKLKIGWVIYEEIGMCVINDACLHKYPRFILWMRNFQPLRALYKLCKEHYEPGVYSMRPRWLAAIAGWTPLHRLSRPIWWLMGKPGENEGILINTIKLESDK